MSQDAKAYRADIDGLRAVSVLAVVAYHAVPQAAPAGFFGVDVFFVISGYLIGGILLREIGDGRFSFASFYARRFRRILPALAVVVTVVCAMALVVLTQQEALNVSTSALSALLGVSNIKFWLRSDYFAPDADYSPLLMSWSLGVEEQFYALFPILILALRGLGRRGIGAALLILGLGSFCLWIWLSRSYPQSAFYLLPARAWELAAGASLAAYEGARSGSSPTGGRWRELGAGLGLAAIVVSIFVFGEDSPLAGISGRAGGWAALGPVLGAVVLIAARGSFINRKILSLRPLVGVGLISYSWYLWHWPMMAFARVSSVGEPSAFAMVCVALASGAIAWVSWRYVEQPFRRPKGSNARTLALAAAALCACMALPATLKVLDGLPQRLPAQAQAVEVTIAQGRGHCLTPFGVDRPDRSARCAPPPDERKAVLLIGDSHASALGPGLEKAAAAQGMRLLQVTKSSCMPYLGVAKVAEEAPRDALACARFMKAAAAQARDEPGVAMIIVAAAWPVRTDSGRYVDEAGRPIHGLRALGALKRGLPPMLSALVATGKPVLLISGTPRFAFDPTRKALAQAMPVRGAIASLVSPHWSVEDGWASGEALKLEDQRVEEALQAAADAETGVAFMSLEPQFCSNGACRYQDQSGLLFIDTHHLSIIGSTGVRWPAFDAPPDAKSAVLGD